MAFTFDAKAALAEISDTARHPATPAIPATVSLSDSPGNETVAGIATVAGVSPRAGKTETGDTARTPDLDAFEERAAIAEYDGGASREEAERMAAGALGFAEPAALFAAAADGWRRNLEALARRWADDPRGCEHIAAALAFMRNGWAEKAAALGWPELGLFGVHPVAPWRRFDAMGAAFARHPVAAVTRDSITYRSRDHRTLTRWRTQIAEGGVLAWEVRP